MQRHFRSGRLRSPNTIVTRRLTRRPSPGAISAARPMGQLDRIHSMFTRSLAGFVMVGLAFGCGPRLRHADAKAAAAPPAEAPVAKMAVQLDASKLDEARKYKEPGTFTVSGLFFKDGEPRPVTVKVTPYTEGGKLTHGYELDLTGAEGASATVEMWDDGILSVNAPRTPGAAPQFQTSNENVKAVPVALPGGQGESTCYLGKDVIDGQVRLALCALETPQPQLVFVDAEPEAPTGAAAPLPEATPAASSAPKAN